MSTSWSTASQVAFTTRRKLSSIIQSPSLSPSASASPFLPLLCSLFQANRRMLRVIFTLEWGAASGRIRGERGEGWGSHIMATEGLQGTAEGTKALPLSPMPDAARSSTASARREYHPRL
jgi:hypothetical protein